MGDCPLRGWLKVGPALGPTCLTPGLTCALHCGSGPTEPAEGQPAWGTWSQAPHIVLALIKEGKDPDEWLCVDFGSMVIHLMPPEKRNL
ncbi:hypothetical protein GH733_014551 [Mirounga leonina]|nr:hypothetical protein GH733_014551 [Mirounga leonina]